MQKPFHLLEKKLKDTAAVLWNVLFVQIVGLSFDLVPGCL